MLIYSLHFYNNSTCAPLMVSVDDFNAKREDIANEMAIKMSGITKTDPAIILVALMNEVISMPVGENLKDCLLEAYAKIGNMSIFLKVDEVMILSVTWVGTLNELKTMHATPH